VEENRLIHEAKNGQPEAFAKIYDRHHPIVYRYLLYRLGAADSAEDLAGDVFVRLAENIEQFTPQNRPLEAWLYELADTLCEQEYGLCQPAQRAKQSARTASNSDQGIPPFSEHMLEAIGRLPEEQKQVILLKFVEGLGDEAIAETLGHSTSTIHAMQWVALTTLAKAVSTTESSVDEKVIRQILDDGLANLAHELRTPLSLIQGYTELLLDDDVGPVAPKQRELLQLIYDRAKRIGDLVHTLTALQMIPRGSLSLAPMSPREWLEETIRDFQLAAGQVGIELRSHIPEHLPSILGDQEHLDIALSQVLDNAIKFSPEGGRIDIEAWANNHSLYIRVADQGVGIEPRHLDRIFDQFYQTDSSPTRQFGGAGLGLALVRAVAEAHRGRVTAESDGPDEGSRFTLALPLSSAGASHSPARYSEDSNRPSPALCQALDACLTSLGPEGATLDDCLASYPEHADELRPLLEVAFRIQSAARPGANHAAFVAGRQRMLEAVKEKEEQSRPARGFSRFLSEHWTVIHEKTESTAKTLSHYLSRQWTAVRERTRSTAGALSLSFSGLWGAARDRTRATAHTLSEHLSRQWTVVRERTRSTLGEPSLSFSRLWAATRERTRATAHTLSQYLSQQWKATHEWARLAAGALSLSFLRLWTATRDRTRATASTLSQYLSRQWTAVRQRATSAGSAFSLSFSGLWKATRDRTRATAHTLSQYLAQHWKATRERARATVDTLSQQWTAIRERASGATLPTIRPDPQTILAGALLLSTVVATVLFVRERVDDVIDQTAALAQVEGVVEVLPDGKETWQPASDGRVIKPGDRIRTGPYSKAILTLFDGSIATLEDQTELTIARMEARRDGFAKVIVLHQWLGETHHRVEPLSDHASRFQVETSAAIAAVRGTEFTINVEDDGATQVRVLEGLVKVTAQNVTVDVTESQETSVAVREPPLAARPISIPLPVRLPTETPTQQPQELASRSPLSPSSTAVRATEELPPSPEPAQRKPPRSTSSEKTKEPGETPATSGRTTEEPAPATPSAEPIEERPEPRPTQARPDPTTEPTMPGPRPTIPSTDVPTPTPTPTRPPAPTATPTLSPAPTLVPTATPSPLPSATPTPVPTSTPSPVPTAMPSPTAQITPILPQGSDDTPTPLPATTPTPMATSTPTP